MALDPVDFLDSLAADLASSGRDFHATQIREIATAQRELQQRVHDLEKENTRLALAQQQAARALQVTA